MEKVYFIIGINVSLLLLAILVLVTVKPKKEIEISNFWKKLLGSFLSLHAISYLEIFFKTNHYPGTLLLKGGQLMLGCVIVFYVFRVINEKNVTLRDVFSYLLFVMLSTCSIIIRYI